MELGSRHRRRRGRVWRVAARAKIEALGAALDALQTLYIADGHHRAAIVFAPHPTRMAQLMAVADAGKLMPPKSTWFEPKLADGLLSHVLD